MLTIGVDLAAEPRKTAIAQISWEADSARVIDLRLGVDDAHLVTALAGADKVGIDCPLGWPQAFVAFVAEHQNGDVQIPVDVFGKAWRRTLAYRLTDEAVRAATGLIPLSVSADKIAHPAMRAAVLLAMLTDVLGAPVQRDGGGVVVEVYPAASLATWRLPHRGYKGVSPANVQARSHLLASLHTAAPWLDLGAHEAACRASDDAPDAVIAALTARAAALGRTTAPSPEQSPTAQREGWIALPTLDLTGLAARPAAPAHLIGEK